METVSRRTILILAAAVLLLRLPFLNQAIQGDDVYYLAGAQHAQINPLHPNHTSYAFLGDMVDMRGHPHPPLNAWFLGLLLAAFGDVSEVPFHTAYIVFSLIAAGAMLSLARRFSPHPRWAVLLFCAVPAFVINGNSFESDVPFLAFWMASVAAFASGRAGLAALAMALAALTAFQAVLLTPVLWAHTWIFRRGERRWWLLALVPPLAIAAWQGFEYAATGALPAAVLQGHFDRYGFQALERKLANAAALSVHALFLVFPMLLIPAARRVWRSPDREAFWLVAWAGIFFAGALAIFFAGSARYLLPMAAPVALLVSRLPVPWLAAGWALQWTLSLGLATVNYQHWDGYRRFVEDLRPHAENRRVWINSEWGLRWYLEAEGGLPLLNGQAVRPGDLVVSSALGYPMAFTTGGGVLTPVAEREIRPEIPLRLIGLETRSAYSTIVNGYLPFDVSRGPIDRVRADLVVERAPEHSWLRMADEAAAAQIVSGVYGIEEGRFRWMGERAVLLLKSPPQPAPLRAVIYVPDAAPARKVTLRLDGEIVAERTFDGAGQYEISTPGLRPAPGSATVAVEVDRTFSVPGDRRVLGAILVEAGFAPE
ncbi:MAG: glycosyltransferase family 39 protein [Bryobacterales bacterium]|nr:glycosyltransferase family 39 protein [Bryobacterales bacterium]